MDYMSSALKNLKGKKVAPDLKEKGKGIGKIAHKPEDGKDPHLDADQDMDHDDGADDKAPDVKDGGLSPEMDAKHDVKPMMHVESGDPADHELLILKSMSDGGAIGRKSMTLGERAKDKMKERIASIEANKKKKM